MQQHTLRLTRRPASRCRDRYPQLQRRAQTANLTPLLAMLLHKLGFPVVVHGVSHDPTGC